MPTSTEEKRQEALQELLQTERTYVKRLTTTFKVYITGSEGLLSESEQTSLFSNLEEVLLANDNFLQELEARFVNSNVLIGDLFLKHIPKFSVYMVYCRNQHSSIQFLQDKMKSPDFSKFIQDALSNPECVGLDLASFLLEPVQRLTRYPMLLKQIQNYTTHETDEYKFLHLAIEESESLLNRVNISMQEGEEQHKLQRLQRRLSSHTRIGSSLGLDHSTSRLPSNLAGLTRTFSERKLLKSGLWIKLKSRRKLLVFLFSDFLLLTEATSGDTDLSLLENDSSRLKVYRSPIHLDSIWLIKEAEAAKIPESFRGNSEFRALEIEAQDLHPLDVHIAAAEFDGWVEAIAAAKRRLKVSASNTAPTTSSIGTIIINLLNTLNLNTDGQYYCQIQTDDGTFRCSSQPSRAPNPVWNQTFALPVTAASSHVEIELFKYSQFEINDSLGRAVVALDLLKNIEHVGTTTLQLEPSQVLLNIDVSYRAYQ